MISGEVRPLKPSRITIVSTVTTGLLLAGALAGCGATPVAAPAPSSTGAVERLAGAYLDTRLEINNRTGAPRLLKLGANCIDPSKYIPNTLRAGGNMSVVGYCAATDADVGGAFAGGPLLDPTWISFKAHSPIVGWPSISIDGAFHVRFPRKSRHPLFASALGAGWKDVEHVESKEVHGRVQGRGRASGH